LKDIEEGHLLIENFVNIFFVTSLSVSLHNLLDFYIYIYIFGAFILKVTRTRCWFFTILPF